MKQNLRSSPPRSRGSALILVLLMIVLLATIAVSFLSTARVEQIATRNFTRQTAARGLADLATGEAMAKIAEGFNSTSGAPGGNYTEVITTQPGAITKYFFVNGQCIPGPTNSLYSAGGTNNANLNRLESPTIESGTEEAPPETANNVNKPSITGNTTEALNVQMQDVTDAQGEVIGRIAYYVDDESTKLNLNAATKDRTTLNVATPRSLSFSALTNSDNLNPPLTGSSLTKLATAVDGTNTANTNINSWSHFFRNGQAGKTLGLNQSQLANMSSAPLSDYHLKYTPWGTKRLHINDQPLDATGVENVFAELSSDHLTDIYGQNFNDKYGQNWSWTGNVGQAADTAVNGLKQTIANMLQMRTPGHHDIHLVKAGYTGPVISENDSAVFPPTGYYAHVPNAVLNEFGIKIDYTRDEEGIKVYIKPFVELVNPFQNPYNDQGSVVLEVNIQSVTFTVENADTGATEQRSVGPFTLGPKSFDMRVHNKHVTCGSGDKNNELLHEVEISRGDMALGSPETWEIKDASVTMGDVKLYAGADLITRPEALRDWLEGDFINSKLGTALATPLRLTNNSDSNAWLANFKGDVTLQRIDPRVRGKTPWVVARYTFCREGRFIKGSGGGNVSGQTAGGHNTHRDARGRGLAPSETANRDIPGDPSPTGDNEPDWFIANEHTWIHFPIKLYTLDANGNATFNTPGDLGKVPTNVNWRRLRFMPRHENETDKNLIPDWAMLDVISFSSDSSASTLAIAPINPNGNFACDPTLNTQPPVGRNNVAVLPKALEPEDPFKIGSSIARTQPDRGRALQFDTVDMSEDGLGRGMRGYEFFRGDADGLATLLSENIHNREWSATRHEAEVTWSEWREERGWPASSLILPGEITEISGVADYGARDQYNYERLRLQGEQVQRSIKENEGRLSAFFPGLTFQGNFFTIYAYAQALDKNGEVQSEALTKTLVEVEQDPTVTTYPPTYKIKKLYTEPVRVD